jgi:hypothetical protein
MAPFLWGRGKGAGKMAFSWAFKEATPGDRARESQVEKFFSSDAVANRSNAIIREGIQNSLDAAPDGVVVRVRVKVGTWDAQTATNRSPIFESGFREHLDAEGVSTKMPLAPRVGEKFRYLTFEDFGTSGLQGDPATWWPDEHGQSEPFFNYFRAEGISGKTEGARGRHGVGRLVFMFASRARSMFGLTRRDGSGGASEELLMGTAVLRNHRLNDVPFLPDGWCGIPDSKTKGLTLPTQDLDFINEFKAAFGISRATENGLSVIVPWLFDDVTTSELLHATIGGYYYPILSGQLVVEIVDENDSIIMVSAGSIDSVVASCEQSFQGSIQPMIELARKSLATTDRIVLNQRSQAEAPKWDASIASKELLSQINEALESGEAVTLRVPMYVRPKGKPPAPSYFDIHINRDAGIGESQINFIREGIIISDVRPRRTSGIRALIVIDEGPLATFLGDSENPSHTQWQKDVVKDGYVYAPGVIDFVTQSIPQLLALISQQQKKPDTSLLLDLFSIPAEAGALKPVKETKEEQGDRTAKKIIDLKKRVQPYAIERRGNGFVVRQGNSSSFQPFSFVVRVAYAVRRGNAFGKYKTADFVLGKDDVKLDTRGCTLKTVGANWVVVRADSAEFELMATGFDSDHRDIRVDVKVLGGLSTKEVGDAS